MHLIKIQETHKHGHDVWKEVKSYMSFKYWFNSQLIFGLMLNRKNILTLNYLIKKSHPQMFIGVLKKVLYFLLQKHWKK